MGTAVLRSQDVLASRPHLDAFRSSATPKPNRRRSTRPSPAAPPPPFPVVSPSQRPVRRQRASPTARPIRQPTPPPRPLVQEEVRILKRGESVPTPSTAPLPAVPPPASAGIIISAKSVAAVAPSVQQPRKPRKVLFLDQVVYAGPGFSASPEPSSLPIPAFFMKKAEVAAIRTEEAATKSLRCLLRIGDFA